MPQSLPMGSATLLWACSLAATTEASNRHDIILVKQPNIITRQIWEECYVLASRAALLLTRSVVVMATAA